MDRAPTAEQCPDKILKEPIMLDYWLACFIVQVRQEDGKPYPLSSLNSIVAGLYCYSIPCVPTGAQCPNFCAESILVFTT